MKQGGRSVALSNLHDAAVIGTASRTYPWCDTRTHHVARTTHHASGCPAASCGARTASNVPRTRRPSTRGRSDARRRRRRRSRATNASVIPPPDICPEKVRQKAREEGDTLDLGRRDLSCAALGRNPGIKKGHPLTP